MDRLASITIDRLLQRGHRGGGDKKIKGRFAYTHTLSYVCNTNVIKIKLQNV